jgi:predicted kinase
MATLHLVCGLPCSGKTTFAKTLERDRSAIRLCPDEWITRLYGAEISGEKLDAVRDPVEAALWELAVALLGLGADVILEFGFWGRAEREDFRKRAAELDVRSELHFLQAPLDDLVQRLVARNSQLPPDTFRIEESRLKAWFEQFEPPDPDELKPRERKPYARSVQDSPTL